ncbi:MAG: DUF1080 domain-containing protein [Isosphaeraceae bacterium]|nr:DUF1080 domain-containing protein [Isosphaeraceae bacterium]
MHSPFHRSRLVSLLIVAASASSAARADDSPKPKDDSLGAAPPPGAVVLFKDSLSPWTKRDGRAAAGWKVEDGSFVVVPGSGDIMTRERFRDFRLHLEFAVPLMPEAKGQARGNSGVYLQGIHELQILDSYGLVPQDNDCGAIYKQIVPAINACKPPREWQTYDITFRAARSENGKVTEKARLTVLQNGLKIIDDREISPTPGGIAGIELGEPGPILLQDHGNEVRFRNIWIERLP